MRYFYLLTLTLLSTLAIAQVGVNNPNPQQALDVNGKLRVTNDGATPQAGTIRFNSSTGEFEGYDGTEWKILSLEKSGGAPTEPIPYGGRTSGILAGNTTAATCTFFPAAGGAGFTDVPPGRFFIITGITVEHNGVSATERIMDVIMGPGGTSIRTSQQQRLSGTTRNTVKMIGSLSSPLIILRAGERLRVFNNANSEAIVNVSYRGFLVDDLDY